MALVEIIPYHSTSIRGKEPSVVVCLNLLRKPTRAPMLWYRALTSSPNIDPWSSYERFCTALNFISPRRIIRERPGGRVYSRGGHRASNPSFLVRLRQSTMNIDFAPESVDRIYFLQCG